ncbi:MAG TPA: hypothetical protein VMM92_11980 [Thermoanaerobaculia bacterium]|nr:hypothetical protein [Thermoanaerobaculia bacterium]
MASDLTTLRIFLMGLIALAPSPDGKSLAILLPQSGGSHFPMVVFPCDKTADCGIGMQSKQVYKDLSLPPANLSCDLLVFNKKTFGAVEVGTGGSEIKIQPLPAGKIEMGKSRSHLWLTRWWFHLRGDIPASTEESANHSWIPSLSAIAPCAKGQLKPDSIQSLKAARSLAAYVKLDGILGTLKSFSVASMKEYTDGECNKPVCNPVQDDYVPTVSFSPSDVSFVAMNQAVADVVVIETVSTKDLKILVEDTGGKPIQIVPKTGDTTDILIGNLFPPSNIKTCDKSGLGHFEMYSKLLHDCKLPVPHVGWYSTRIAKSKIGQAPKDLPGVLRVVSEESPSGGGLARPICSVVTN